MNTLAEHTFCSPLKYPQVGHFPLLQLGIDQVLNKSFNKQNMPEMIPAGTFDQTFSLLTLSQNIQHGTMSYCANWSYGHRPASDFIQRNFISVLLPINFIYNMAQFSMILRK